MWFSKYKLSRSTIVRKAAHTIIECTDIELYFECSSLFREKVWKALGFFQVKEGTFPSPKHPCFRAVCALICRAENVQVCADLEMAHGCDTTFRLFWESRMEGALWQNTQFLCRHCSCSPRQPALWHIPCLGRILSDRAVWICVPCLHCERSEDTTKGLEIPTHYSKKNSHFLNK